MIEQAIQKILSLAPGKPRETFAHEDGGRLWLFSDKEQAYAEVEREYVRRHTVSSMESFVTLVAEEMERSALEECGATLILTKTGGTFIPQDTGDGKIRHTYARALDPFWKKLAGNVGQPMKHVEFIRFLSGMAPVIHDYETVARQFRKVYFDERLAVTSQPLLDADGRGGNAFNVEWTAKGATATTALPAGFVVTTAYTRGSEATYTLHAEIDLQLRKDGEKAALMFSFYCPDLEAEEVKAQADEEALCRTQLAETPSLLILTAY